MQVLSDLLYGAVIAGVVLLIVLSLKLSGGEASIDAAQFRAAKIGMFSLVEAIERDFSNIGAQHPDSTMAKPEDSIIAWDTLGVPAYLVFWAQTDSAQAARPVCYAWQEMTPAKTAPLKSGPVPLIKVERRVGVGPNCTGGTLAGMSTNMITRFNIHLMTADSTVNFTNLNGPDADVQQLRVQLRAVSPLGPGTAVEETRWEKLFRPVNLWKRREV